MPGAGWTPVRLVPLAVASFLVAAVPGVAADSLEDPEDDAAGLDVVLVSWTLANGTARVEVRFQPGEVPDDRAVRGVLLIGTPGEAAPAEWYQFTIANETHAFAGHAGPADAAIVATSWTGDLASVELQRQSPAPDGLCAFAVVEAGTMDAGGFVRSDVAPPGFGSPEAAWPVDSCPEPQAVVAEDEGGKEKGSPGLPLAWLLAAVALGALARRRGL